MVKFCGDQRRRGHQQKKIPSLIMDIAILCDHDIEEDQRQYDHPA